MQAVTVDTDELRRPVPDRDYLERTIATVRNHRGADNCWPQWANIFADEIERCWALLDALEPDPRLALATGPLTSDLCECDALCECDQEDDA